MKSERLNLVASALRLGSLRDDDPAITSLAKQVEIETGIDRQLTKSIISSLQGADYLGTLLRINKQVDDLIANQANNISTTQAEQLVVLESNHPSIVPKYHLKKQKNYSFFV